MPRTAGPFVAIAVLALAGSALAMPPETTSFRAAGGRIVCQYMTGGGGPPVLRCEIARLHRSVGWTEAGEIYVRRLGHRRLPATGPVLRAGQRACAPCRILRHGVDCRLSGVGRFVATTTAIHVIRRG